MARERKTRTKGAHEEVVFGSVMGNKRANRVRMEEFPLTVTEPLVNLERERERPLSRSTEE